MFVLLLHSSTMTMSGCTACKQRIEKEETLVKVMSRTYLDDHGDILTALLTEMCCANQVNLGISG